MSSDRKRVLAVVHNGFASRYLLRTSITAHLRESGAEVVALVPNPDEEDLRADLGGRVTLDRLRLDEANEALTGRRGWRELEALHRFGKPKLTGLDRHRLQTYLAAHRGRTGLYSAGLGAAAAGLRHSRAARALLRRIDARCLARDLHREVFERHRPDVVVTTSAGYAAWPIDATVMLEARRRGVPTVAAIYAWDNPSTIGFSMARPDRVLAWSQQMRDEVILGSDLAARRVEVTGPAIFDVYATGDGPDRGDLLRGFGLDPERPLVFLGTMSPFQFPYNPTYTRLVAEAIARGRIDAQLVVRLHPIYYRDPARRILEREEPEWRRLSEEFPFLALSRPRVFSDALPLDMPDGEMAEVAALVRHAGAVVSFFSTLQLEAAVADVPSVAIAFDLPEAPPETRRPSLFEQHDHNRRVVESGSALIARSAAELVDGIARCLARPDEHRRERRRLAEQECAFRDGRSGERAAAAILRVARHGA